MQLKAFIKNLAFVQIINFIVKPLWILAIDRYVQNTIGLELYGQYHLIFSISAMLFIVTDLGLNNYMTKAAVDGGLSVNYLFRMSGIIKLTLSFIYLLVLIYICSTRNLNNYIVIWVGINQLLLSTSQWLRVWFNANRLFVKESIIGVIDRFIAIFLWLGLVVLLGCKNHILSLFLGVQTIGFIVAIVISVFYLQKGKTNKNQEEKIDLKAIIKACLPFSLLAFLMAVYTRIDVLIMDFLLPNADYHIGVYAQGYRILDAGNIFAALFASMLLPIFTKQINDKQSAKQLLITSSALIGISCLFLIGFSTIGGEYLYKLLYKNCNVNENAFAYKLTTFKTVLLVYIPIAFIYIFGTYLTALHQLKLLIILASFTLLINITSNIILIPKFQANGAAISALITQGFFCLACFFATLFFINRNKKVVA